MSSILFDPATSSGNPAGARPPSKSANDAVAGMSFDSFLAKNQSRYEASDALRSDKAENDRGHESDRDYKTSRTEDRHDDHEATGRTESVEDDYSNWDDEEDLSTDSSDGDVGYSETEEDIDDQSPADPNAVAVQSEETPETTRDTGTATEPAATPGPATGHVPAAGSATNSNASASGNAPAAPAGTTPAAHQSTQTNTPAAAAASQQAVAPTAANGNQATNGKTSAKNSATASVSNNTLVSQSNTALTSGSAVVTLQSVDPKTSAPAGQAPVTDTLAAPQTDGKPNAASEPKPVNAAAQAANTPNQAGPGSQTSAVQAAAVNPAAAQAAAPTSGALPTSPADTLLNLSTPQAATSTGTPAFTSLAPVGGVTQTANATGAGAAASGNASAAAATPSDQVAVEIRKGVAAGKDAITIKLNPAELGKIDVKMEINDDGTLRATIAVEKSETLDLLQKDSRGLERALQNAGLQADSGSLNFSLSGQGNNSAEQFETASNGGSGTGTDGDASEDPAAEGQKDNRSSHDGALDISV